MNKNLIIILYFGLAAVGLVLVGLVTILAPEQLDKTVQNVLQVLGLGSTAAVTIYLLGNQSRDIAEVKAQTAKVEAQTNGTLTRLQATIDEKDRQLAEKERQLLQVVASAPPASADG